MEVGSLGKEDWVGRRRMMSDDYKEVGSSWVGVGNREIQREGSFFPFPNISCKKHEGLG